MISVAKSSSMIRDKMALSNLIRERTCVIWYADDYLCGVLTMLNSKKHKTYDASVSYSPGRIPGKMASVHVPLKTS